jgi:HAD superfamily hydrolase (TIGR01509 family)
VPIRGLLFDFDGLLVDTEGPALAAWQRVYEEHGHELPLDRWTTVVGTVGGFEPLEHLEELVGTPLDGEAVNTRRREHELQLVELEQLRPGIAEYLADAQRLGLELAIVSSSSNRWIDSHLRRLEQAVAWNAIVAANGDAERAKPRPTLYLEALDVLGLAADEAVAFEDSPNGIRAAKAAGIVCVAVPNPVTASLGFDEADLVLDSLADLPLEALLQRLDTRA